MKDRNWIDFSIYACIIEVKAEYLGFSHSRKVEHFTCFFRFGLKTGLSATYWVIVVSKSCILTQAV